MTDHLDRLGGFLRALAEALHISGMPAHDLERHLNAIGRRLGVRVDCFAVLTMITLNIVADDGSQRVEMIRLPAYDYNMTRLIALEKLSGELQRLDQLAECARQLQAIMAAPPLWRGWSYVLLGALLSGAVAVLLRGGWREVAGATLVGLLFVGAQQWLARNPRLGPAVPVILCTLAALGAQALSLAIPGLTVFLTALAGIVLLLPGFTLTIAMSELATQNLLAGSARLVGACMLLFMMGAGLAIGSEIGQHLLPSGRSALPLTLADWLIWPAVAAMGVAMLGLLQAPWRAAHVLVGGCLVAWAAYAGVSAALGNIVGAFAGALAVATAGHLYHRLSGQPDILVKIPGLIVLVPGSMGFRGLHALMEQDSVVGVGLLTEMLLTGAVLAVGLLLADNIAPLLFGRRSKS